MSPDQIASILWRRRFSFLAALAAGVAAVVAVTLVLPKAYSSTAILYVGGRVPTDTFVNTDLLEEHTRTYATLAANPNVADLVVRELPIHMTRDELLQRMSFAPVERTQLLQISAEGKSPEEAMTLANTYAAVFVRKMSKLYDAGKTPTQISVSQRGALPSAPFKPNPPLYIGLGTLLAVFLALAVTLVRERLDTRVRVSPADDTVLGQPIVARIPRIPSRGGALSRGIADRFGVLRTNVDFFDEQPARAILVTSPGVSEGKSTVASHLALACAADGERVVLVEADLRRPGLGSTPLAQLMERSPRGLSNYLAGAADETMIITTHPDHPELSVIWSGIVPPNPSALLGSQRLDTLISSLRLDFDRIIIDSPPISVGADASVIASRVDGVLYIVDERKTNRAAALAGLNQLRGVRAQLFGIVLNRASILGDDEAYYYRTHPSDDGRPAAAQSGSPEAF